MNQATGNIPPAGMQLIAAMYQQANGNGRDANQCRRFVTRQMQRMPDDQRNLFSRYMRGEQA